MAARRFAGINWTEARIRAGIVGAALALLVIVVGVFGYQVYRSEIARPNDVILRVGDHNFSLGYYRDRLGPWFVENGQSGSTPQILEDALLDKLLEEALTLEVAADQGIQLSDEEVTKSIAEDLGTTVDSPTFDTLYRARLESQNLSNSAYRRMSEAAAADKKLLEAYTKEVGEQGEQLTLRTVVLPSKEAAEAVLARVRDKGEDLGTISQTESLDVESRTTDGVLPPEPASLLPENVRAAVESQDAGTLLGPVQVQDNWWIFRIEKREEAPFTIAQKSQLAQAKLDEAIAAKRAELAGSIDRELDADDIRWAERNLKS